MTKEWKPTHKIIAKNAFFGECVMAVLGVMNQSLCRFDDGHLIWYPDYCLVPITSEPPSVPEETKSPTAPTKTIYKCPNCGDSDSLLRDAYAIWVEEEQRWELFNMYDEIYCHSCSRDFSFEEVFES